VIAAAATADTDGNKWKKSGGCHPFSIPRPPLSSSSSLFSLLRSACLSPFVLFSAHAVCILFPRACARARACFRAFLLSRQSILIRAKTSARVNLAGTDAERDADADRARDVERLDRRTPTTRLRSRAANVAKFSSRFSETRASSRA